jgi:MtN3 and saliva related transmembrane protein
MALEIVGYLAGFIVAIALSPQVIKAWKTKSTKDISVLWNIISITGLILWVVYAIVNLVVPLAVFASVEALMAASLLVLKLKYG